MKIDLHLHLRDKTNHKVITSQELIDHLDKNDVRFASLTEHNVFDKDLFCELSNLSKSKNIVFVPGMEINVFFNQKKTSFKHIIVYSDPETMSIFQKKINNESSTQLGLFSEDFFKILNDVFKPVLISPHFNKDEKRSFIEIDEVEDFFKNINNALVKKMIEFPKKQTNWDAQKHIDRKFHSVWFSDIKDWNEYDKIAKDLPKTNIQINSLNKYIVEFVDTKYQFATDTSLNLKLYKFKNKNEDNEEIKISLSEGLNIIFGGKGSGKSDFLNSFWKGLPDLKDWEKITFGEFKSSEKTIRGLYDLMKKKEMLDNYDLKKIKTKLEETIPDEVFSSHTLNIDFKFLIENIQLYNSKKESEMLKKNIFFVKEKLQDDITKKEVNIKNYENISEKLSELLNLINNSNYNGSIEIEDLKKLIVSNIKDWVDNFFSSFFFKNKYNCAIDKQFKAQKIPEVRYSEYINKLQKNISPKTDFILSIKKILNQKGEIFDSYILDKDSFVLSWKAVLRKDKQKITYGLFNKTPLDKSEIEEIKKLFEYQKYNLEILTHFNIQKKNVLYSDLCNIWLFSKHKNKKLIPSTGQFDMLLLDVKIKKNKNLVIDDFCNSFDNDYVYRTLIPKLNNYKKMILVSTHNPLIAVLPQIGSYIFKKKDNNYKIFLSKKSIYTDLINIYDSSDKLDTKEQLLQTIEGTKKAFMERKTKYGI